MPDSILDEKVLKRSFEKNQRLVLKAMDLIDQAALSILNKTPPQKGLNFGSRMLGLFSQRLYFSYKTKRYSSSLHINVNQCIGCGLCVTQCPTNNISLINNKAVAAERCTMCYRCISYCPKQAITLLGHHVIRQYRLEDFIKK